ncbi:RUN domain-containing protein 1 [Hermetia illucens]|uniref:RUN domain-containing protein 1 n=1 Tax=Hermetia illucens TaxID=343691 RepID=UPI0018CC27A7|nr:RUN domain-containing protein 1 [Hermetia illucens]
MIANENDIEKLSEDDDEEEFTQGPGERWDPLGADDEENVIADTPSRLLAAYDNVGDLQCGGSAIMDPNRIRSLEEEQEILTTSLMALTSHFAQVQFRLRQIVDAPITQRDQLLKNLEEFAFRGIPEVTGNVNIPESDEVIANLERARSRQFELIDRLKKQLTELEKFAYESGAPVLPQSIIVEKQKIIIDELKNKLNLNVNDVDLPQLSSEDIKSQVDTAIGEFVGPLKMKEQLVAQLKTQITDLERFIAFLQHSDTQAVVGDGNPSSGLGSIKETNAYNTYSAKKKHIRVVKVDTESSQPGLSKPSSNSSRSSVKTIPDNSNETASFTSKTHTLLSKASTLLQMFAVTQFGCGSSQNGNHFRKNTLKKSSRVNHWGDTRAQLEVDIQEVAALAMTLQRDREKQTQQGADTNIPEQFESYVSDSDDEEGRFMCSQKQKPATSDLYLQNFSLTNVELTTVVRKNLAVTLQKLIQHGLRSDTTIPGSSLVPFIGCFQASSQFRRNYSRNIRGTTDDEDCHANVDEYSGQMHAWELILQYYAIKNGEHYNETPSRKLSQSFNLDIVGTTTSVSNKQSLLSAIGTVIAIHKPYKRSYNSHFKAFVCAALNARKLVVWLNLIFQCNELINTYYMNWSYVAQTGFRDALHSLDSLTKYEFDLPIDLAVRQFQNIKDVFM